MFRDFNVTEEEAEVFLAEAEEQIQVLEGDLVRLEEHQGGDDVLAGIFRAAHTLKGSSATVGHERMAGLTHALETVLDLVRSARLSPTSEVTDVLFEAVDLLRGLKDELVTGVPARGDLGGVVEKLQALAGGRVSSPAAPKTRGLHPVQVTVEFDEGCIMPAVRALQVLMALEGLGEIVHSTPTQEQIDLEEVGTRLEVYLVTKAAGETLENAVAGIGDLTAFRMKVIDSVLEGNVAAQQKPEGETPAAAEAGGDPARTETIRRTVRVDVSLLDSLLNLVGELVIDRTQMGELLGRLSNGKGDEMTQELARTFGHIGRVTTQLQEEIMKARMLPVDGLFKKFPRMMRDLRQRSGKRFRFVVAGEDTELDRSVIECIGDPLIHLLRNAVDHGLEDPEERASLGKDPEGEITLAAFREENEIIIRVEDDGGGIDPEKVVSAAIGKGLISPDAARRLSEAEAMDLIFAPGLSTSQQVTDLSGRGVGLDVVRKNIEDLNGRVEISSVKGRGTTFDVRLPLTLATIQALLVRVTGGVYALPLGSIIETIKVPQGEVQWLQRRPVTVVRGRVVPLLYLADHFAFGNGRVETGELFTVLVNVGKEQVGLVVDALMGEQEVVVKSLGHHVGNIPGLAGATVLGDGSLALILDIPSLIRDFLADGDDAPAGRAGHVIEGVDAT